MSSFVLCSDETYQRLYQKESYKWMKLEEIEDLLGYAGIHVYVHDYWHTTHRASNISFLEEQIEALAMYKYIKLYYVDTEGHVDRYITPEEAVTASKQLEAAIDREGVEEPQVLSEADRERLIQQEDGCAGGACTI